MPILKPDYYIGIDPDVLASGFALWNSQTKAYEQLKCLSLWDMFAALDELNNRLSVMVRLEAGWKAKGLNWHRGGTGSANDVGRNHEIGRQIEKYCQCRQVPYELVKPLGYSSFDHERFCAYTNWPKTVRTNSETRVAGMLVYGY